MFAFCCNNPDNGTCLKKQIQHSRCGGTLINRKTVLTASHCNVNEFDYDYKGVTYQIPIHTNEFYASKADMFSVYVGVHDKSNRDKWPAKAYSVSKIINVKLLFVFHIF